MKRPVIPLLAVASVFSGVVVLYAMRETNLRRVEPGNVAQLIEPLPGSNDLALQKSKGKYKYKKEEVSDAQQGWKLAGEMPTSHNSFDGMGSVRVRGRRSGDTDALNHMMYIDPTGIKGRNGDRYKQKFSYYSAERSEGHHRYPSWGFIKMWLERAPSSSANGEGTTSENRLRFLYVVTKANEGGELLETEYQDDLKQEVSEQKKIEGEENLEFGFNAGAESHGAAVRAKYKAKQKKAKGTML